MTKDATQGTDEGLFTDLQKLSEDFLPRLERFIEELPPEYQTQAGECLLFSVMLTVAAGALQEMGVSDDDIVGTCTSALDEGVDSIILTPQLDTSEEN